jgi:hypothetical protein
MYSPRAFDVLFALLGIICASLFVQWSGVEIPAIAPAANPLAKGAALTGVAIAGSVLSTLSTKFDQKWADDYVFQTLSKSALMAVIGFIFAAVLYTLLFAENLGRVSSYGMIALLCACWSVSYFIVRLRGTGL